MKKIIAYLIPVAFLPVLSGCITKSTLDAAKDTTSQINNKMAVIEKASVTKDGQLCVFFVSDLTNSVRKTHFTLIYPLAQIQTNAQGHVIYIVGSHIKQFPLTYGTLQVPGNVIQPNWNLLESQDTNLTFFPVGPAPTIGLYSDTVHHFKDFQLLPDATQTIYLTRNTPIEFVYVDQSTKMAFTIVDIDPTVITEKHSGYYFLLPLTVPADIVTLPIQAILYGFAYLIYGGMGRNC